MRPHPLLLALCLVVLAAGGALWWSGDEPAPLPPGVAAGDADADAGQGGPHEDAEAQIADANATDGSGDEGVDGDFAEDEDGGRTAVDQPEGPLPTGPRILVVRGDPPTPVPGAVVFWIEREEARRRLRDGDPDLLRGTRALDLPHRFGRRLVTGVDGRCELPPLQDRAFVACIDEERSEFAGADVAPRERNATLTLQRDETVTVLVRDGSGEPAADVAVQLSQQGRGRAQAVYAGSTDANGTMVARHFQLWRQRAADDERFDAVLALPLSAVVRAPFAGRPAQSEPVELRLPPTAALTARLVHRSGVPVLQPLSLQFASQKPDVPGAPPLPRGVDAPTVQKPAGDDPFALPHVGIGAVLTAQLRIPGERRPVALPPFRVPAPQAGAPVAVDLVLPETVAVVAGRFFDQAGTALAGARPNRSLTWRGDRGELRHEVANLTAAADGRFDFLVPTPPQRPCRLHLSLPAAGDGPPLGAELDLGVLVAGERLDLGAVALRPLEPLVTGTVVDDRREPLEGVSLRLQTFAPDDKEGRWVTLPLQHAQSRADGSYAVHGTRPELPFRVLAEKGGHRDATSAVLHPGARADLRLDRYGVLRGRVLLPDFVARGAGTVQLAAAGAQRPAHSEALRRRGGGFAIGGITPGLYDLTVHLRNLPDPLFTLAAVRVDPGDNRDPRLELVDLRAALFRYELRAVGPGGRELADLDAPILWRTAGPGGEPRDVAFRWRRGRAELVTPIGFLELLTIAPGYPPTPFSVPPGQHDVYLAPVLPLFVDLPGVRAAVGPGRAVRVSLIGTDDSGLPQGVAGVDQARGESFSFPRWFLGKSGGGWLDAYDRAECSVSRNGPYEVVLRVGATAAQNSRQVSASIGRIDAVVTGATPQVHRLAVDPTRLAELVAQLEVVRNGAPPTRGPDPRTRNR